MNLTGPPLLNSVRKKLRLAWSQAQQHWDDSVQRQFEQDYVVLIEESIQSTLGELATLAEVFSNAEKECR